MAIRCVCRLVLQAVDLGRDLVAAHPELCGVLAAVIARRLGVAVNDCCDRGATLPRCCFEATLDAVA